MAIMPEWPAPMSFFRPITPPIQSYSLDGLDPCGLHPMFAQDVAARSSHAPRCPRSGDTLARRRRALSSPRIKTPEPPSLTRRRSVRSMKNLLPLTLPSSNNYYSYSCSALHCPDAYTDSSTCTHCYCGTMAAVEAVPTFDACNFPELLAHDLASSSPIFAARQLTAGAPSRELAYGDGQWRRPVHKTPAAAQAQPSEGEDKTPNPPADSLPSQLPVVRFEKPEQPAKSPTITYDQASVCESEADSTYSGHSYSEAEPPSIRQPSVVTAATSVTTGKPPPVVSHKRDPSLTNASWIDFEPDDADATEWAGKKGPESPPRASSAYATTRRLSNPFEGFSKPESRTWSLQVYPRPPSAEGRRRSLHCIEIPVPQRRSSLRNQMTLMPPEYPAPAIPPRNRQTSVPILSTPVPRSASRPPKSPGHSARDESPVDEGLREEIEPWFRYLDEQGCPLVDSNRQSSMPRHRAPPSPITPMDEVQGWLESSLDDGPDEQSRRIPLPPEVVETLRVSITCFPETMLLCSSLSVETIRSYARKMKHPAEDLSRMHTPPPSPKRWKWSTVLGQRRSASSLKRDHGSSELKPAAEVISMHDSVAEPQWSRLRNVFPQGSDYLLDALFAHLVTYSYVSLLCPRGAKLSTSIDRKRPAASPPRSTRSSTESLSSPRESKDSSSNDIPRKAAKMLGLQELDSGASLSPQQQYQQQQRLVRKKSSFMDSMRSSRLPPPTQAPAADQTSMKDIQAGLARCIGRLVATLRAGPAEGDELPMLASEPPKGGEIDPLLVRTLCEIVRCCEES